MAGSAARISLKSLLLIFSFVAIAACARNPETLPSADETGDETGTRVPSSDDSVSHKVALAQGMTLRYEKAGVLEAKVDLPAGTQVEFPVRYDTKNLNYRKSDGSLDWSSTGFIYPVKIVSVPAANASQFPASKIAELNQTSGGLFLSASIVGTVEGIKGNFAIITPGEPGSGFLTQYNASGKPKFNYQKSVIKRFGDRLNVGVDPNSLTVDQRVKWQKIYDELKRAADRTVETPKSILMIDQAVATQASIDFEKKGTILANGAWTIATLGTAVRHGFPDVPCAEFQSELLRQAYQRAGYKITDDFSAARGNQLIWSNTAAVVNFSMALYKAGFVPWDSLKYRPLTGAFLMNGSGLTPGHAFMSAGDDGRFILDNGYPQGRDLRKASGSTIEMMYQNGVFFLPPGINPPQW